MLDPRWRKVQRDLWLHRARTLLVVTAVALGLIGAGSILNAWALVRRATIEGFLGSLPVSATLTVDRIDAELLAQVRALPEIAAARSRRTVSAAVQSGGAWRSALLFALDDFEQVQIARLQTDTGPWPPGPGELLIERSALELSGASIGETLSIKLAADQVHTVKLVGSVRDVSLAPGWMDHVVYAFLSSETLTSLGAPAGFNQLQLRVRDAEADQATVRRIAWKVKDLIEARGITVERVEVPVPGEHMHAAQMDSLLLTQGAG